MPHIHEKIDFTAEVFIVYKNRVLLRVHDKYKLWLSVGGHVELDEDPNQAVIREAKEEVGLEVKLYSGNKPPVQDYDGYKELIPPMFMNINKISETHQHVTMTFFGTADTDRIVLEKTGGAAPQAKWFTAEELDDPQYGVYPHICIYAKEALNRLST